MAHFIRTDLLTADVLSNALYFGGHPYNACATVEPAKDENVMVLIWRVQELDEAALDRYEGAPRSYEKQNMNVVLNGEQIYSMAM